MRTLLTMWAVEGMWAIDRPADWVGRDHELAVLRAGVEAVRRGEGAAVWVEGDPGIGKSTLVAEALAETSGLGWDVGWGIADRLTERLPLRVMLDCLQVRADEASLVVWHQLAASIGQLPLLLIATCRLSPRRPEVRQLRSAVARRGGQV